MNFNLGIMRTYLFRALPVVNGVMLFQLWIGWDSGIWRYVFLATSAIVALFLDWLFIFKQEINYGWRKSPAFQELLNEVKKRNSNRIVYYSATDPYEDISK